MKRTYRLLVMGMSILLTSSSASAIEFGGIGIAPGTPIPERRGGSLHYEIQPGQNISDHLRVLNTSDASKRLSLEIVPGYNSPDNHFSCATKPQGVLLAKLSEKQIEVAAHSEKLTQLSLLLPAASDPGEYTACVVAIAPTTGRGTGVSLQPRVALRIAVVIKGKVSARLKLDKMDARHTKDTLIVTSKAHNLSSLTATTVSNLQYRPIIGKNLAHASKRTAILPHASQQITVDTASRPLWGGIYRLKLTTTSKAAYQYQGKPQNFSETRHIILLPQMRAVILTFLPLGALGLTTVLLLYRRHIWRKRLATAMKIRAG